MRCNVCTSGLNEPVYRSPSAVSITSLCDVLPRPTEVFFCRACGHLQTPELPDLAEYYDEKYKILVESEEEDQLYDIGPLGKVFRADHQLNTLLAKVPLGQGAKVLDYGCAKGSTLRRLSQLQPDLRPHLFDVSRMYVKFWERFAKHGDWATHEVPANWAGRFDLITSFYSLEHVAAPGEIVAKIAKLLRPGGVFYAIVPDTYQNVGDFVVADHVNHFSPASFARLLTDAGLSVREIDTEAQKSAMVAVAVKSPADNSRFETAPGSDLEARVQEISKYWRGFGESVRRFEADHARTAKAAIYGSGFYGTFVSSCLEDPSRVVAFLDQNPFRQGQRLLGKPVVAPDDMPTDVEIVYVGLNPAIARDEMAKLTSWSGRKLDYWFP